MKKPDGHRIPVEFAFTGLDGSDDDEDGVQDPEDGEKDEADQDQAKDGGDGVVNEHGDLKIERFLAVRVDLGGVATLDQPDNQGPEKVTGEMKEDAEQGAGMTERAPGAHVGEAEGGRGERG